MTGALFSTHTQVVQICECNGQRGACCSEVGGQDLHRNPPATWAPAGHVRAVKGPDEENNKPVRNGGVRVLGWIVLQEKSNHHPQDRHGRHSHEQNRSSTVSIEGVQGRQRDDGAKGSVASIQEDLGMITRNAGTLEYLWGVICNCDNT